MSLLQGLGFQIKEAYPIAFHKCVVFIVWLHFTALLKWSPYVLFSRENISLESKLRFP